MKRFVNLKARCHLMSEPSRIRTNMEILIFRRSSLSDTPSEIPSLPPFLHPPTPTLSQHEAAMLSLPASQIRRSSADTVDISGLDSIRKALEGRVALVDPTAKEDQLKRVLDSVVWFGRAVKVRVPLSS